MKIEIWSDVVCPWCYIGRRRFEKALDQFEHRNEVEVIWRSYQLDPNAPRDFEGSVNDLLAQRYGLSQAEAASKNEQVVALAALEGLEFHFDKAHPVNTLDAHRLLHLAAKHHLQGEMKERLQKAYFTEGLVISDHPTLVRLAEQVGLNGEEVRQMLESDVFTQDVQVDEQRARAMGSNGVPFFVFEEKYAVSGAQPSEIFLQALDQVWQETHPVVKIAGLDPESSVCNDESCAV